MYKEGETYKMVQGVPTWASANAFLNTRYRVTIEKWTAEGGVCQKDRLSISDYIGPVVCHFNRTHARSRGSIDNLSVSPEGHHSKTHLQVIEDSFNKCVYSRPSAVYTAEVKSITLFI